MIYGLYNTISYHIIILYNIMYLKACERNSRIDLMMMMMMMMMMITVQ